MADADADTDAALTNNDASEWGGGGWLVRAAWAVGVAVVVRDVVAGLVAVARAWDRRRRNEAVVPVLEASEMMSSTAETAEAATATASAAATNHHHNQALPQFAAQLISGLPPHLLGSNISAFLTDDDVARMRATCRLLWSASSSPLPRVTGMVFPDLDVDAPTSFVALGVGRDALRAPFDVSRISFRVSQYHDQGWGNRKGVVMAVLSDANHRVLRASPLPLGTAPRPPPPSRSLTPTAAAAAAAAASRGSAATSLGGGGAGLVLRGWTGDLVLDPRSFAFTCVTGPSSVTPAAMAAMTSSRSDPISVVAGDHLRLVAHAGGAGVRASGHQLCLRGLRVVLRGFPSDAPPRPRATCEAHRFRLRERVSRDLVEVLPDGSLMIGFRDEAVADMMNPTHLVHRSLFVFRGAHGPFDEREGSAVLTFTGFLDANADPAAAFEEGVVVVAGAAPAAVPRGGVARANARRDVGQRFALERVGHDDVDVVRLVSVSSDDDERLVLCVSPRGSRVSGDPNPTAAAAPRHPVPLVFVPASLTSSTNARCEFLAEPWEPSPVQW